MLLPSAACDGTSALNNRGSTNGGFLYYGAGQYEDAVRWFERAIKIDPQRAIAYLNLGDAYVQLKRHNEAKQNYERYLELAPNSKSAPSVREKLASLPATATRVAVQQKGNVCGLI